MSFDLLKTSNGHWLTQLLMTGLTMVTQGKLPNDDKKLKESLLEITKKIEAARQQKTEADEKDSKPLNERKIQVWMQKHHKKTEIFNFFKKWPKADQHQHGEAIISANEYAEYAAKKRLYFDPKNNKVSETNKKGMTAISDTASKEALKRLMDVNNCPPSENPNEFFFRVSCSVIDSITEIMPFAEQDKRIIAQLVEEEHTYAPIMIDLPQLKREPADHYKRLFASKQFRKLVTELRTIRKLKGDFTQIDVHRVRLNLRYKLEPFLDEAWRELEKDISESVKAMEDEFAKVHKQRLEEHGKRCPTVKYIFPVMRDLDHAIFFQQTAKVFALMQYSSSRSKLVRGYQLVGSETDEKAKENYLMQMLMIDFCRRKYPKGNAFLHTGELAKKVEISHTKYYNRIYETINLGCADLFGERKVRRISHATSLTESDILSLKINQVCVEVCLTSNEKLLGIKTTGNALERVTPLHVLRKYGVPFTICADDPTHLGTTLSKEYARAILECGLTYQEIKNSQRVLRHFSPELDGESIYEPHPEISGLMVINDTFENVDKLGWEPDDSAKRILRKSEMAREQVIWEMKTAKYEEEFVKANSL